ncbi:MAG: glycosyltransferase [Gammaproteobacteria bacterium]|nr:MAG: glycosyltransferase [Gammaproteobacteria bacterium]
MTAPIVLFVYNRPDHTKKTIEALSNNKASSDSNLFIFSDGPKTISDKVAVDEVRNCLKNITGFKSVNIIERAENIGLANNVIQGVTEIVQTYGKVIVLEDDIVASPVFIEYMNSLLSNFESRTDIFSVTGYNFPSTTMKIPNNYKEDLYLSYRAMSWGWGTWKDRWQKVDWNVRDFQTLKNDKIKINQFNKGGDDLFPMLQRQMLGEINSWAIRFCYAHFVNKSYCIYPVKPYVKNIGFDGSGVHCNSKSGYKYYSDILAADLPAVNKNIEPNEHIFKAFHFVYGNSFLTKVIKLMRLMNRQILMTFTKKQTF